MLNRRRLDWCNAGHEYLTVTSSFNHVLALPPVHYAFTLSSVRSIIAHARSLSVDFATHIPDTITIMDPTYQPLHGYPLIIAQYAIAGHTRRTEHWAFIVLRSRCKGDIHELRGNSDSFMYVIEHDTPFAVADALRGGCHVGYVPKDPDGQMMFRRILEHEVRVVRADAHWDCQNWIVEGLRALKEAGLVFRSMCEAKVRKELREEMERWESADDAVYERLFPE